MNKLKNILSFFPTEQTEKGSPIPHYFRITETDCPDGRQKAVLHCLIFLSPLLPCGCPPVPSVAKNRINLQI